MKFKSKFFAVLLLSLAFSTAFAAGGSAQEPATAPSAAAQSAPDPTTEQVKDKDRSSESNVEAFTHTRLVQSIGKAMGLSVDATAKLFLWINFAIVFFAIVIPLARILPKALRKRRETLARNLEEARKTTADANSRLSAVEARLAKLDDDVARIRSQVDVDIKNDEARIKASLAEESARIVAAAEQEIALAAAQAQRGLKAFAADLAIDQAVKQLTLTAEADRALIEGFVAEVGSGGKI